MDTLPDELTKQLQYIIDNSNRFDRPQSFPFFPDDWLGSPGILTAHPAVEGAYIHLLAIEWGEVDLWLPSDSDSLATSSRLNLDWPKYAERLLRFFYKHPFREGLVNHKLVEIRFKQLSYASRGQAGGLAKGLAEVKQKGKLGATPHPLPHPHPVSSPREGDNSASNAGGDDEKPRAVMTWFYSRWEEANPGRQFPFKSVPYTKERAAAVRLLKSYPNYEKELTGLLDDALHGHYFASPPDCLAVFKPTKYTTANRKPHMPRPKTAEPEKSLVEIMRERGDIP